MANFIVLNEWTCTVLNLTDSILVAIEVLFYKEISTITIFTHLNLSNFNVFAMYCHQLKTEPVCYT